MAGRTVAEKKVSQLTPRVNVVETTASFQTVQGKYRTGENGKRITVVEGKSELRPYNYFNILEGKIQTLGQLREALGDIHEQGNYPVARLLADINYGLEHSGKASMSVGLDPAISPQQRANIERVRGLMHDGLVDFELASAMLDKVGLSPEQIASALTQ